MTALYYPFINFRDQNWVRVAAIYWDQIYRIVPHLDQPDDPQFVKDLRTGGDGFASVIFNYNPHQETHFVSEHFIEFVDREEQALKGRYLVENSHKWKSVDPVWLGPDGEPGDRLAQIYIPKMGSRLTDKLLSSGLAKAINDELVGMHPELAFVYMSQLASEIGRKQAMTPATESNLAQQGLILSTDRLFAKLRDDKTEPARHPGEMEVALLSVTLDAFMPKGWEELSARDILQAKKQARTPLEDFRKWMQELIEREGGLEKVDDRRMVQLRLKQIYDREIKDALHQVQMTQRKNQALKVVGGLTLTFAIPATLSSIGIPMDPTLLKIGGGALTFAAAVAANEKMDSDLMKQKGSFILKLNPPRKGIGSWLSRR